MMILCVNKQTKIKVNKVKWIGELYIIPRNESPAYIFDNGEPDAFVETETKQEAYNMLAQYDLTMGEDDDIFILVRKGRE